MLLVLDRCDVIIVEMIIIVCCGGILGIYRFNSHKRDLLLSIIRVRYKKKKTERQTVYKYRITYDNPGHPRLSIFSQLLYSQQHHSVIHKIN